MLVGCALGSVFHLVEINAVKCAAGFHKKPSGQPGLSGAGRLRFKGGVPRAYCCGALSPVAAEAAAAPLVSAEIAPLGDPVLLLTSRVR
jgi:hypothetical protein